MERNCYDFETGDTMLPRGVGPTPLPGLSVSPDGRWIAYTAYESESDIVLVEHFR